MSSLPCLSIVSVVFFSTYLLPCAFGSRIKVDVTASKSNEYQSVLYTEETVPVRLAEDFTTIKSTRHYKNSANRLDKTEKEFENPVYRFRAFGENILLRLEPDTELLAPTYTTVHSFGKSIPNNSNTSAHASSPLIGCFYKGVVVGKATSRVALSICDSLRGSIDIDEDNLIIVPLHNNSTNPKDDGSKPHSIHKRSIKKTGHQHSSACAVNERRNQNRYQRSSKRIQRNKEEAVMREQVDRIRRASTENFPSVLFNNQNSNQRNKRSFESKQYYIEVMLVADPLMVMEHGHDLEHYLLTIMMMANKIFAHPSLGSAITLSVVKIIVLESDDNDLTIGANAAHTLNNFCAWQKQFNTPDDTDPRHFDLAILFTRKNLCSSNCDTLGMAEVGAMCSTRHSCAIIEDDGLSSSHTLAHEVGHVLNMMHDDNKLCRENKVNAATGPHIMSSTISRIDDDQPWSECSRKAVTDFLTNGRGDCLLDKPQNAKVFPKELPGEMYDVNSQCEMTFGTGATACPYMAECGRLWCQLPNGLRANQCHTRNFPKADGSPCTPGSYCLLGECVPKGTVSAPINGGWSAWSQYGRCSRTCGGGVQMSSRQCNNPMPQHGGNYCIGSRMQFISCNTKHCPLNADGKLVDYRSEQCSTYNGQRFPRFGVQLASTWIPKYSNIFQKDRCKLICESLQTGIYITLSDRVVDGTKCGPNTSDICVHGQCMPAGCDGVLGSKAKFNKCGLCKTSNKRCRRIRGKYNKRVYGYNDVVTFPVGAASIKIQQKSYKNQIHDGNYLALVRVNSHYLLNGDLTLTTMEKNIELNGTTLKYTGVKNAVEKISSTMPLNEPITLQVLSLGISGSKILPPHIKYSYYMAKPQVSTTSLPRISPTHVSGSRSSGQSKSNVVEPRWVTGRWSKCKVLSKNQCGIGWKKRKVTCKSGKRRATSCTMQSKPYHRLPCHKSECPTYNPTPGHTISGSDRNEGPSIVRRPISPDQIAVWNASMWSSCSSSCGFGIKRRQVICQTRSGRLLPYSSCNFETRPASAYECKLRECR